MKAPLIALAPLLASGVLGCQGSSLDPFSASLREGEWIQAGPSVLEIESERRRLLERVRRETGRAQRG